jgi:hypothetical protein
LPLDLSGVSPRYVVLALRLCSTLLDGVGQLVCQQALARGGGGVW